jgi:hypothetical protein
VLTATVAALTLVMPVNHVTDHFKTSQPGSNQNQPL